MARIRAEKKFKCNKCGEIGSNDKTFDTSRSTNICNECLSRVGMDNRKHIQACDIDFILHAKTIEYSRSRWV